MAVQGGACPNSDPMMLSFSSACGIPPMDSILLVAALSPKPGQWTRNALCVCNLDN